MAARRAAPAARDAGAEDGAGAFRVMVHGTGWSASDLQTALQALGATVGANNYDASGATAADFTY